MRNIQINPGLLLSDLKKNKIMTVDELKSTLKTQCRMTVFRKLSVLGYISSYSHRGKYYSLKRIARYNKFGIWACSSALFSNHGTLKKTIGILIEQSIQGYTALELTDVVKVKVEDVLLELVKHKTVIRKKISGVYVYFSTAPNFSNKQELTRITSIQHLNEETCTTDVLTDELRAALIIFYSTLDEKQRRLYAGYESLRIGHGGDKRIGELLDLDQRTVSKGRNELLDGQVDIDRIREPGGGRNTIKKTIQR